MSEQRHILECPLCALDLTHMASIEDPDPHATALAIRDEMEAALGAARQYVAERDAEKEDDDVG